MADPTPTPTSPFSVGSTLKPAAGEQKITREQAATILAEKLRAVAAAGQGQPDGGLLNGIARAGGALVGLTKKTNPLYLANVALPEAAFGGGNKDKFDTLATKLATLLPDDALYESVLNQVDRRQLLSHVMSGGVTKTAKTIGGVKFDPSERALAGDLFSVEQDQAVTAAKGLAAASGITGDAAVTKYVEDTAGAFRTQGTALGLSPSAPAALQAVSPTQNADGTTSVGGSDQSFSQILANGVGKTAGNKPFLTDGDVQALFRLSSSDLGATNDYLNSLAQYRANVNPAFNDPFKVQAGVNPLSNTNIGQPPSMLAPEAGLSTADLLKREFTNSTTSAKGARGYSITEAKDLLYGMSKDEVAKMQNLLLRAGYFADANGKSVKPLFTGDPTDQTTQRGWLQLIGDSIRSGQPVFDTLSKKALDAGTKFSNADGTIAQDVVLTDSAQIAQGADTIGQQEIGRKLTDDEHAKVIEFIHGLESKAQNTSNEPGAQTVENPDTQAEINQYIQQQFPTEAAGKDVAGTYDEFTKLLAGPGVH